MLANKTRAFHKLHAIFQKVSRNFSKRRSKVAFCHESCSKLLEKTKTFVGLMLKYANCTTKVRFLSIFAKICRSNSVANHKISLSSIKTKKRNDPIKLWNDLLHLRHSSQSSVNLRPPFLDFGYGRKANLSTKAAAPISQN